MKAERAVRVGLFALIGLLAAEVAAFTLSAALPPDLGKAERSSPVVLDRQGAWLRALPVERGRWRIRADLDRTDPIFLQRLVAIEDKRFWLHPGVDPVSVARAAAGDLLRGRITSGGSTLTMQAARRLEPRPRTLVAKAFQAARAVELEARFTKRDILALYLTLAPYGGPLEGVRAASLAWFGHEPSSLTDGEQALLIALPQSPEARRPDRHPQAARRARAAVLSKLVRLRMMTQEAAANADAEPLPTGRAPFPGLAWQVAGELARHAPPAQPTVISTLDAALQKRLEPMAAAVAAKQGDAASAAILVIEVRTRAVRAAVASAGRDRPGGWVDMTHALRSPGSALKPFIYAMAFDQGLAAPDTTLTDAPTRFAGYAPENFDRAFHDKVTAREALANSLNVPAVATLAKLGPDAFEARLNAAGAHMVRPRAGLTDPGLALALGGEGITLRDMALLYAALADDGLAKPLAWTDAEAAMREHEGGVRLVRAEAAQQVIDILRESPPPPGRAPTALVANGAKIAFKTGTSYGYRDAVAAGIGGGYVVVVWTGRPDGGARPGLTGREASAPLLFDVFDALHPAAEIAHAIAPKGAPLGLTRMAGEDEHPGPHFVFPPDGSSVEADGLGPSARGLALAARGQGLHWYVEGQPLATGADGQAIWRPAAPGFYRLEVTDAEGRKARARVRVTVH
jgi:penicillin-binding protein 1C